MNSGHPAPDQCHAFFPAQPVLHITTDLSVLAAHPDDLGHGFDLLTLSYATSVANAARAALRDDPAIAPLIRERYWGHSSYPAELLELQKESLGHFAGSMATTPGWTSTFSRPTTSGMWCASCSGPIHCTATWKVRRPAI